jgi:hypothetical protein
MLWSQTPVDQARARGQITHEEHLAIVEAIHKKHQVRENAAQHWVVNDPKGLGVAEIQQRRDGTFVVHGLMTPRPEPVVCNSQEQAYQWIERLSALRMSNTDTLLV